MDTNQTQRVYEAALTMSEEFEPPDHLEPLGFWHEAERLDPADNDLDFAEHRVHVALEIPIDHSDHDGEMYASDWYRPLITYARREYGLQVSDVTVKLGYEAREYNVLEAPGAIAEKARVNGLVELSFAFPEDLPE